MQPGSIPQTGDDYRQLRSREFETYFPREAQLQQSTVRLELASEQVQAFERDFQRLLKHRRGLQGLSRARDFRKWWEDNRLAYLTEPVVETYRRAHLTLGEFLDETHLQFITEYQARRNRPGWAGRQFRRLVKHPVLVGVVLAVAPMVQGAVGFLWNLMILGPGVQMINSYTQPVITPLSQTASQKGSQDLAPFASWVQAWLTDGGKLKSIKAEMRSTAAALQTYDFRGMTPEQARKTWHRFEQTFFKLFLTFNQALPSHLRDGRSFYKDWMMLAPIGLASNLATFDTQYWVHARELETLKASGARGPEAREQMRRHREQMEGAEDRLAATLAAWKIYEFMYPEFARNPANAAARTAAQNAYQVFTRSLHFDVYVAHFAGRMNDVLKDMDLEFAVQDLLVQHTTEAGRSRVPAARPAVDS